MTPPTPTRPRRRPGFTLVELLMVLAILGILIGLLVPAVMAAVRRAQEAAVLSEIASLGNSLTEFKNIYGDYPPSRVILKENGFFEVDTTTAPGSSQLDAVTWLGNGSSVYVGASTYDDLLYGDLAARSLTYLRKFFPRAQFSTTAAVTTMPGGFYDFNGNGTKDTSAILLQGHECLVFFLGGIPNLGVGSKPQGMTGFARNPLNPFQNDTTVSNRTKPLFEFKPGRLGDGDGDHIPGYFDSLGTSPTDNRFYQYFSAYGATASSGGYDPNDENSAGESSITNIFRTAFPVSGSNSVTSPAPNPYTGSPPVPGGTTPASYLNPQTFQIISPGRDRLFGAGGQFSANSNASSLPPDANISGVPDRNSERDNLTNFYGSRLD